MASTDHVRRRARATAWARAVTILLLPAVLGACGTQQTPVSRSSPSSPTGTSHAVPPFDVSSSLIRGRHTRTMQVWAPTTKGAWPVVYGLPGISGHRSDFDQLGPALAAGGTVVITTDYRPLASTAALKADVICGYRYALRVAARYGADPTKPVTGVGYSNGARLVGALRDPSFGPGGSYHVCPGAARAPAAVVAVDGCYFAYRGVRLPFDIQHLGGRTGRIVLISGQHDRVCAPWQSARAARLLTAAHYDTTLVRIPGADHETVMFHHLVHGTPEPALDRSRGTAVANAVLQVIAEER